MSNTAAKLPPPVNNSGTNTRPIKITGSNIYALTNLSTNDKKKILGQSLQVLGYSAHAIAAAQAALTPPATGGAQ